MDKPGKKTQKNLPMNHTGGGHQPNDNDEGFFEITDDGEIVSPYPLYLLLNSLIHTLISSRTWLILNL